MALSERKQTAVWLAATSLAAAFGIVMLVVGVRSGTKTLDFLDDTVKTDAVIVEFRSEPGAGGAGHATLSYPVLAFTDTNGQEIRFQADVGKSAGWSESVGDTLPIRYHPEGAHEPRLSTFFGIWGLTAISLGMGLVFTLLSLPIAAFCALALLKPDKPRNTSTDSPQSPTANTESAP